MCLRSLSLAHFLLAGSKGEAAPARETSRLGWREAFQSKAFRTKHGAKSETVSRGGREGWICPFERCPTLFVLQGAEAALRAEMDQGMRVCMMVLNASTVLACLDSGQWRGRALVLWG